MDRTLIVENDVKMQEYLREAVSGLGGEIVVAQSGHEADEFVRQGRFGFAIISETAFGDRADLERGIKDAAKAVGPENVVVVCQEEIAEVEHLAASIAVRACLVAPFELVFIPDIVEEVNSGKNGPFGI